MSRTDQTKFTVDERHQIEQELAKYTREETHKLGLQREQWVEPVHDSFTAAQRPHTIFLISGLTLAHDRLCSAALRGIGYRAETLDCPDNAALQFGKEFGNRGQCNPTYFTVGNLIKHLFYLRDIVGLPTPEIIGKYVFLTAGACGPCRFGTYVTEYRKALRDAGFEGFRVLLFQQQGGIKQANGCSDGLKLNKKFFWFLVRALVAGDVLNLIGYRMRPYEKVKGATNAAIEQCKNILSEAFENDRSVLKPLFHCRRILAKIELDRTVPKPVVSIIGEFWAMTTEGDGNYQLQRFLEQEGAEVDVQGISNWLLFMLWEHRYDTRLRMNLRQADDARKGLKGKNPGWTLLKLAVAERVVRGIFQFYANVLGLHRYRLPDMEQIATLAGDYYDNNVRGGEGHMEVGKVIHFIEDRVNHMTVSVKPFGCMPSSGVSDGVLSFVVAKWPEAIFIPIETTGDSEVNAHSRIQMMLYKARKKSRAEFEHALGETGLDKITFQKRVNSSRRWRHPFSRPAGHFAGIATNLVYAVGKKRRG